MIDFGFRDRVICVTGGASGIGRAAVLELAREGARIAVLDWSPDALTAIIAEAKVAGADIKGYALDVCDAVATEDAVNDIEAALGPIDGLIAAAGIGSAAPVETLNLEEWSRVMAVNATGVFLSCQAVGRMMLARKRGSIVVIGSIDGLVGHPGRAHYVASKHAVHGLVKNLALEWGRHGLRVNAIAPGSVLTPMQGMPAAFIRNVANDRTPLGRLAAPEEIAAATLMLLSEAASYVNGAILPVDGGLSVGLFTHRQGADLSSKRLLEAGVYSEAEPSGSPA